MQLPIDLYDSIANHLHEDRNALRSLCLTSKVWCAESQRVLFRTVLEKGRDSDSIRNTHNLFLQAIILNPTLGSYVHAYEQRERICHPHLGERSPVWRRASHTWALTEAALPAMFNLKHLCVVPLIDNQKPAPLLDFKGCSFSLRTLVWGFYPYNASRTDRWVEFLRTQRELLHLEISGRGSRMETFAWLTDDACPNLRSALCWSSSPIIHRPKLIALGASWHENGCPDEIHIAGLRRLKYLSIPWDLNVILTLGGIDCNLVLLEISGWRFHKDKLLFNFPNLRVLVFIRIRSRGVEVAVMEDAKTQMVIESFRRCPMLEYIVMETRLGDGLRRYRKLSIPQHVDGPSDTAPVIQNEEFIKERNKLGTPWWTAYGV